jgi:hypothetical protein
VGYYNILILFWDILQNKIKNALNIGIQQGVPDLDTLQLGGHRPSAIPYSVIKPFLDKSLMHFEQGTSFWFIDHILPDDRKHFTDSQYICVNIPLNVLVMQVTVALARKMAGLHGIKAGMHANSALLNAHIGEHICGACKDYVTILTINSKSNEKK